MSVCLCSTVNSCPIVESSRRREDYIIFEGRSGTAVAITVLSSRLINLFRVVYEHASLNCCVPSAPRNNDQTISPNYYIANYCDLREKSHCPRMILVDMGRVYHRFRNRIEFFSWKLSNSFDRASNVSLIHTCIHNRCIYKLPKINMLLNNVRVFVKIFFKHVCTWISELKMFWPSRAIAYFESVYSIRFISCCYKRTDIMY